MGVPGIEPYDMRSFFFLQGVVIAGLLADLVFADDSGEDSMVSMCKIMSFIFMYMKMYPCMYDGSFFRMAEDRARKEMQCL